MTVAAEICEVQFHQDLVDTTMEFETSDHGPDVLSVDQIELSEKQQSPVGKQDADYRQVTIAEDVLSKRNVATAFSPECTQKASFLESPQDDVDEQMDRATSVGEPVAAPNETRTVRAKCIAECVLLTIATLFFLIVLAAVAVNEEFQYGYLVGLGFNRSMKETTDRLYLQVTPISWNHLIAKVVVSLWQVTWICYAWSFRCRPNTTSTIPQTVYLLYVSAKMSAVIWAVLWLNLYPGVSFVFVVFEVVVISVAFRKHSIHFHKLSQQGQGPSKIDVWLTRVIVANGFVMYATSLALDTLLVFGVIVQYDAAVSSGSTGILLLVILACILVIYSIGENTVLDKYFRHIYVVYPVVIWFLIGSLFGHWKVETEKTTSIISLLVLLTAAFFSLSRSSLLSFSPFLEDINKRE